MNNLKTGPKGIALIKEFESVQLKAYKCPAGVWTIGVGHTGPDVTPGMVITEGQADEILNGDLRKFERAVNNAVKVPLTQTQFDALVSFTFNVGEGNLKSSTLLKLLNEGKYQEVPAQLMRWNKAGGKELAGLTRRRKAEGDLWNGLR